MTLRATRIALGACLVLIAACSGDHASEPVGIVDQALTSNERILGFEGIVSTSSSADWRPVTGTAASSTAHSEGTRSIALSGNWNPSAISAPMAALGTLTFTPSVDVLLPTGYQPQTNYYGQLALFVTCAPTVNNQYLGPVALNGPTGAFRHYTFPALPANVATALSTTNGCTVTVQLNLSNAGTLPVLVDKLSLGQATGGSGGTGGLGGGGAGNAGAAGRGGAGAGGAAGRAGGAGAGAGGAGAGAGGAGAAGQGGAGGSAAGQGGSGVGVEFFIDLPVHVARPTVALGSSGGPLTLTDGVRVLAGNAGFSSVSSVKTAAAASLGVSAEVQHLWAQPNVNLANNALVHGNLATEGTVATQLGAQILGSKTEHGTLTPVQHQSWTVPFPATNQGAVNLEPTQVRSLFPGAYAGGVVKTNARLILAGSGRYTLDGSLDLEPSSVLDVDNAAGPVHIYVRNGFIFRGSIAPRDPGKNNILIGVAGTGAIPVESSFNGILVAPYGDVTLGTTINGHWGAVYAKSILASPHTDFHHRPLEPGEVCGANAACDGLCQCNSGGSCATSGDCATDVQCCGGVCGGAGCGCSSTSQCASGSDCKDGTCQNHCLVHPRSPECVPAHCSNGVQDSGETATDCGGSCPPCSRPGDPCEDATDCSDGLVCGNHNGGCFNGPRARNVCWPASCADGEDAAGECGQSDSPCGPNCDCVVSCDAESPSPSCPPGEECKQGFGTLFGVPARDVCVTGGDVCPSDDPEYCGRGDSICGECICTPDCSQATCAQPSDHCGGICRGVCPLGGGVGGATGSGGTSSTGGSTGSGGTNSTGGSTGTGGATSTGGTTGTGGSAATGGSAGSAGTTGAGGSSTGGGAGSAGTSGGTSGSSGTSGDDGQCRDDMQCPLNSSCESGADGRKVCRPSLCSFRALVPPLCGAPPAPCGPCPVNAPQCSGRECGRDPATGLNCGSCNGQAYCDDGGRCRVPSHDPPITVPDPDNGGETTLDDLPDSPTAAVGTAKGGFTVSDRGTGEYTIPIEVPPGRNGLEPRLSLRYVSANTYSDQGVGWRLDGISKITRCPRSQSIAGYAAPIKNDTTDSFCLDGQLLIATNGKNGESGTVYHTAIDTFSKITSLRDEGDGLQLPMLSDTQRLAREKQGPDYFEVRTTDGKILTYGHTSDSLAAARTGLRFAWLLNKVEDRAGNTVQFGYENYATSLLDHDNVLPNLIRPIRIAYTGHGDVYGNRVVRFDYEDRPDEGVRFQQGGLVSDVFQRLRSITTYVEEKAVRTYWLHYRDGQYDSQMDEFRECAGDYGDLSLCKPPTRFGYIEESGFTSAKGGWDLTSGVTLDANGDGTQDIIHTYVTVDGAPAQPLLGAASTATNIVGGAVIGATLSLGVGLPISFIFSIINGAFWGSFAKEPVVHYNNVLTFSTRDRNNPIYSASAAGLPCPTGTPMYLLDYDRDGKDDVGGHCGSGIQVGISRGDGRFAGTVAAAVPVPKAQTPNPRGGQGVLPPPAPVLFDADGDSLEDILYCPTNYVLEFLRRKSPTEGFEPAVQYFIPGGNGPDGRPRPPSTPIPYCSEPRPTYNFVDVDGDGVAELLVAGPDGWVVLRYKKSENASPKIEFEPVTFTNTDGSMNGKSLGLGDYNGDGLIDIAKAVTVDNMVIWLNAGNGHFVSKSMVRPLPALTDATRSYARGTVLDYNGDGRADFLEDWQETNGQNKLDLNVVLMPDARAASLPYLIDNTIKTPTDAGTMVPAPFTFAVDLDGDSNRDLIGRTGFFYGSGAKNTLLNHVVDGLGNLTRITYGGYKGECSGDQPGNRWPEVCLKQLNGTVFSVERGFVDNDGTEVYERHTDYTFRNARVNAAGGGWLGFESSTIAEATSYGTFRTTTTDYEPLARYGLDGSVHEGTEPGYVYPLAGMPKTITMNERVRSSTGDPSPLEDGTFRRITVVSNHWSVGQSWAGRPFPRLDARETYVYDQGEVPPVVGTLPPAPDPIFVTGCSETFQRDGFGNTTDHVEDCGETFTHTITDFTPDADAWLVSNPELITVSAGNPTFDPDVQVWDPAYDSRGLVQSVTRSPEGPVNERHTTTYTRDDYGNPYVITESVETGEAPRTTTIEYDSDNVFPLSITNALGHKVQVRYDERFGGETSLVDANGIAQQRSYDAFGRLGKLVDPDGATTITLAGIDGAAANGETKIGRIRPRVSVTSERWDADDHPAGRSVKEIDSYGRVVRTTTAGFDGKSVVEERIFDNKGRLILASLPHVGDDEVPLTAYTYDERDRVTKIEHRASLASSGPYQQIDYASSATLKHEYWIWLQTERCSEGRSNCNPEIVRTTDETGHQDVRVLNQKGQPVRNVDGNNVESVAHYVDYVYDGFRRLRWIFDGEFSNEFSYDSYGHLTSYGDIDTGYRTSSYNGFDELTSTTDNMFQRFYTRDDLGRVLTIEDDAGTSRWTYDEGVNAIGRVSQTISPATAQNPDGNRVDYTYESVAKNNRGRLKKETYTIDGVEYSLGYRYDAAGRVARVEYPDLRNGTPVVARYNYDDSGELTRVDNIGGGANQLLWRLDDAFHGQLVKAETLGNGAKTTYDYDPARRFVNGIETKLHSATIQKLGFTHYDNGLTWKRTTTSGSTVVTREHTYDALNRLDTTTDQVSGGPPTLLSYGYDQYGNLAHKGTTDITPQPWGHHVVQTVDDNVYEYDANANVRSRVGPDIPGGSQVFTYTSFGLPSTITTGTGSHAQEVSFEYTADEERLIRRDPDTARHFVGDLYQRLADAAGHTQEERFRLYAGDRPIGEIVRASGSDKTLYFHPDDLGSISTISNDTNDDIEHLDFDVFGGDDTSASPELTRAGFTGHQHDRDLGLIDMRGRVYDPLAARFTTADPVMQRPFWSQGLNRYAYCFNDPINNTDPSGFSSNEQNGLFAFAGVAGVLFGGPLLGAAASGITGALSGAALSGTTQAATTAVAGNPFAGSPGSGAAAVQEAAPLSMPSVGPKDTSRWMACNGGGDVCEEILRRQQWEQADRNIEAVREGEWELFYAYAGESLLRGGAWLIPRLLGQAARAAEAARFLENASRPFRNGPLTEVGRALTKHPNVIGETGNLLQKLGGAAKVNARGADVLKNIVESGTRSVKETEAFGRVVDYRLSSGIGARFSYDSEEFVGFLGRGL